VAASFALLFSLSLPSQKSGEIGHSLSTDLLDEFGSTDDVRDAVANLYLGEILLILYESISTFFQVGLRQYAF
jgi:hypothetical protein